MLYDTVYKVIRQNDFPVAYAWHIHWRCCDLEKENIEENIQACIDYIKDKGMFSFINESDDCKIWDYI